MGKPTSRYMIIIIPHVCNTQEHQRLKGNPRSFQKGQVGFVRKNRNQIQTFQQEQCNLDNNGATILKAFFLLFCYCFLFVCLFLTWQVEKQKDCCLPWSAMAGSKSQEMELGFGPRHSNMERSILTTRTNIHPNIFKF